MSARRRIHLAAAVTTLLLVLVGGATLSSKPKVSRNADPWLPQLNKASRLQVALGGFADAAACTDGSLIRTEAFAGAFVGPQGDTCAGKQVEGSGTVNTYCSGGIAIAQPSAGTCHFPETITCGQLTTYYFTAPGGTCIATPAVVNPAVQCETLCPPANPPCCKKDDCSDCKIEPLSIPAAELSYTVPVFSTRGAGYPSAFNVFWRGRSLGRLSRTGPTLGPRASHSLSFFLTKGPDSLGGQHAHVATEDGDVASFTWSGSAWVPENGRKHSLSAAGPGSCPGQGVFTEEDGTVLRFNDYCSGVGLSEGSLVSSPTHGIDRPNGDYVTFTFNGYGQIATATNRIGEVRRGNPRRRHLHEGEREQRRRHANPHARGLVHSRPQ